MKRKFGLRAALTLLVLIAIAPVFGVLVQSSLEEQQARLLGAEASLKALVEISAAHQEGLVEGARQMLTAMAHSPPVYGDDLQACVTYMQKLQSQYPTAYGTFGLVDDQGRLTCRAAAPPNPVVASDRLFFRTAVQTGGFGVGEFVISRTTGQPILTFGLPVYRDGDHSLRGVAYVAMDVRRAHEHLRKLALPPGTTLLVADSNAVVIATTGDRAVDVGAKLPQHFLRQAVLDGLAHFDHGKDSDGGEWIYALQPIGQAKEGKLYVAAMVSSHDILAPGAQRLHLEIAVMALIAFVGGAAAWVFGDRVVARPIDRMLQRVNALRREETRPPGAIDSPLALFEVHELDVQFEDMARGLAERSAQRDAAMAEMLAQKNLLESILQSMAEGVLVIDSAGRFAHANSAAHRIMPAAAGLNRPNGSAHEPAEEWDFFHLDGVTPLAPAGRPALCAIAGENLESNFRYIIRGRLSGGAEKIIQGRSRRLPSPQGDQYTAVIVFSDITADYRAEQALKDSEQHYRTLFESNPHPMWVYDVETLRFLTVNDAAVASYGYSRKEFMAMTVKEIRPVEDVPLLVETAADGRRLHPLASWRHRQKDGSIIHVEVSSHALHYAGRRARMTLAHDITQRRLAQEALQQMNETLERRVEERTRELAISNRELESFAYSVSHDLRAPLQVIDGFSRALISRYGQALDAQARHFFERIRENTRQMGELIDDLLSLARVTRSEIRAEQVELTSKCEEIVQRLRQRDLQRQVDVEIDQEINCSGDPKLLSIVLENLIENAWKFTGRTPTARIRIGRRTGKDGENVIYVADNGAGFDMAYSSKLFNPFQRLHAASEFEGTGIGLATVHRIVTRHGGRVWAESSPGQGATFHFTLNAGASDEK